ARHVLVEAVQTAGRPAHARLHHVEESRKPDLRERWQHGRSKRRRSWHWRQRDIQGELRKRHLLRLSEDAGGDGIVVAARELREARGQRGGAGGRREGMGRAPRLLPRPDEPRFEAQAVGGERIEELPDRSELLLETRPHVIQALRFGVAEVRTELALEPGTRGG